MSTEELLLMLKLGGVALTLGAKCLRWLARHLWLQIGPHRPLMKVMFFPSPLTCVEHLYNPDTAFKCSCSLPHGLHTSFSRLLEHLLSSRVSLDLCLFSFSHMDLSRAVLQIHSRGVTVRVLVDRDYMTITGSQINVLFKAGICLRYEQDNSGYMHHKFALVDGKKLITGSLNWTASAVQSNRENVIVTEEPQLVRPYQEEFCRLWAANNPANHTRHKPNTT